MYVIMGGTGHVGSAVARALLSRRQPVTLVVHDVAAYRRHPIDGADIVAADVEDVGSLRAAFRRGRRAFLLNPPADTKSDTDVVERRTIANILAALDGSGLEKVVAESTGGVRAGERLGDLGTLWELEQGLRGQPIPAAINRAAYYMTNWDGLAEVVRKTAGLPSMYPADLAIPMIAPGDLGELAASRLLSGIEDVGVRYAEGPTRYSPSDVARVFAALLGRPVKVEVTPPSAWQEAYRKLGFSEAAAQSYANMTAASLDGGFEMPDDAWHGTVTLEAHLERVLAGDGGKAPG